MHEKGGILLALGTVVPGTCLSAIPDPAVAAGKHSDRTMTLPLMMVSGVDLGVVLAPSLLGAIVIVTILALKIFCYFLLHLA